uniref:Ventrally expressed dharma/bozozok antagonist n=1 Tax=Poecilia formosa TaxID=48698 RepID=A0A096MA57_POEFO
MKGHFSIEWLAQSSKPAGPASGPAAWGTHSESLPGFYCKPKPEKLPGPEQQQHIDTISQEAPQLRTCPRNQGESFTLLINNSTIKIYNATDVVVYVRLRSEAGFSSCTEEETSGYESEGGQPHSPSAPAVSASSKSQPSPPVGRRPRTAFTAEQISSLEGAFKRNAYLGTQDKAELCKKLNLSDKQIRNWFQNRRMKLKRTVQDALAHANVASHFLHYPELQAYRTPATYVHPHSLQYSSPLSSTSALPLDSVYEY